MSSTEPPMTDTPAGAFRKPIDSARKHVGGFVRQMLAVMGLVHIAVAIPVGMATPFLPIGLPIAIIGVILLGRNSTWGRRWMEGVMTRHPRVEQFAPNWLMRLVFGRDKRDNRNSHAD